MTELHSIKALLLIRFLPDLWFGVRWLVLYLFVFWPVECPNWLLAKKKAVNIVFFFSIRNFFHGPSFILLYHFHPPSRTFRHLFETLQVRLLSHIFNRYSMRFTTLLNYYLIDWYDTDFCLFACWFDFRFCYSYFTWEISGLELASTIILILQANRLSKCASGTASTVEVGPNYLWQVRGKSV